MSFRGQIGPVLENYIEEYGTWYLENTPRGIGYGPTDKGLILDGIDLLAVNIISDRLTDKDEFLRDIKQYAECIISCINKISELEGSK